jgi:hypothetical protein
MLLGASVARYGDRKIIVEWLEERGVAFEQLRLNPSDISPEVWCDLFNFNINEPPGIALYKAVCTCRKKYGEVRGGVVHSADYGYNRTDRH